MSVHNGNTGCEDKDYRRTAGSQNKRDVIQNVSQRIKTPESIYAKMLRKNLEPEFSLAKEKLNDLIGIRIVCLFLDDVYEIAEMLKKQKDIKV